MILAIDIGNTATKAAAVGRDGIARRITLTLDNRRDAVARLARLGAGADAVAVASVVPAQTRRAEAIARAATGGPVFVVGHRRRLPITIAVRRPSQLGADRIAAACGAVSGRRRNAIVVDVGSAITVDLVRDRRLLGGAILPGPGIALSALHEHTGRLPRLRDIAVGRSPVISDTRGAIAAGVGVGTVGAITEIVRWLQARHGGRPAVLLTGGWAPRLRRHLPAQWVWDPDLVFRGLYAIAMANL